MLFLELKNLDAANNLCKICDKYKDKMNVDIKHGRYVIDGCSILAVTSLIGKIINICPVTNDESALSDFKESIKNIGGYEVDNEAL